MKAEDNISRKARRRIADFIAFLYVEHAIIEQDDSAICIIQGKRITPIPIGEFVCIILGPGTSITHRAIQAISETDCLGAWTGEYLRAFYATGRNGNTSSQNLLTQAKYWAGRKAHCRCPRNVQKTIPRHAG